MAGQFSPTARPPRPGAFFDFVAQTPQPVFVNTLGRCAVPFTHSWGPANQVVTMDSFADFLQFFSDGGAAASPAVYTGGYKAVRMTFQGEGLPGRGGAGEVLGYRMVGAGGVASFTTLQNTTPVAAITLTAVYKGTYGNNISASVVANAADPTNKLDLNIYVNGFLTETFTFAKTDITGLAAAVNSTVSGSKWVVASGVTSGTALAVVTTPVALAGGNDGATLTGTDFTNMLAAFGTQRFGTFSYQDIASTASWANDTGSAILTQILTWQKGLNTNGKRFMTIIGGDGSDTAALSKARSLMVNDYNVINIGIGTYTDAVFGTLTTSQLAPRLAGIIAGRTEKMGLSFARLAGLDILSGASDTDILSSLSAGVMTISRDSSAAAPIRFEKGLTTWVTADTLHPLAVFNKPKFVLTMQSLENELTQWAEENVIGILPVDDNSVSFVIGNLSARLKLREADQIIQPGWTVVRNPSPPPTPQDDFIATLYGISFTRDMEQVLNTVVVS